MARSMTGFGKAARNLDGDAVVVEVSAVNHRFLDCGVHLPGAWAALEPVVKETVRKHVSRGRVNIWVMRKRGETSGRAVQLDREVARQYVAAARELARLLGTMETLSLDTLAGLEGVFFQEEAQEDLEKAAAVLEEALHEALSALDTMRTTEGRALAADLRQRMDILREVVQVVEARLPELNALHEARLRERLAELTTDTQLTEDRLAVELALLADKGDVTEEVVRLRTHMEHVTELLEKDEPTGRELNFLAQELQREANTLSAKVRDSQVAREVMRMKAEVEKFREQVQNIE